MKKIEFSTAVKLMSSGEKSPEAVQAIFDAVEILCETSTDGDGGESTPLWDWLSETGGYTGNETPDSIAQEWDELNGGRKSRRKQRYGKLVRGWDWRTTPGLLEQAERDRKRLGLSRTEYLENAIMEKLNTANTA